jgi:hypothetical protein
MSDYNAVILTKFIDRSTGKTIDAIPTVNRITINKDIRNLSDTFDFDLQYKIEDAINIVSHSFVEFYFTINNVVFQVCCGFIEDFVKEISSSTLRLQANGRDFLGQLFSLPFNDARPFNETTLSAFAEYCISDSYLKKYQAFKSITRSIVPMGVYSDNVIVPQLTDAKRAPVLQSTADEVFNIVYQNRFGQMVLWGRDSKDEIYTNKTINDVGDFNVSRFVLRENFSKVVSHVKIFWASGENLLDTNKTASQFLYNSEFKAKDIYQPEYKTFESGSLLKTDGKITADVKKDLLAQSIMRKSNQNLAQVAISTPMPFHVDSKTGEITPYDINQIWKIKSDVFSIDENMRLVGIGYTQDDSSLEVQLLFVGVDTLV